MIDPMLRVVLSPLLIAQALQVGRKVQVLPEADGPRSGRMGTGPTIRLRILGDSSAAGVGVAKQSEALAGQLALQLSTRFTVEWHLDAISAETTRSTLTRLRNAPRYPTDIIVTALGVNDITRLIPARIWLRQHNRLLARLRDLYQPRHIYLSGIPPVGQFPLLPEPLRWSLGRHADVIKCAQTTNANRLNDVTDMHFDLPFDPDMMASDGFHPTAELYALWAKEMASRIISDWPNL